MKTTVLILCSVLLLSTGCASLHQVGLTENEGWIQEAQRELLNKEVTVVTWQGLAHDGKIFQLNRDSLLLQEEESRSVLRLPLNQVSTIRPSRNVFPPIGGFVAGLILGGVIGGEIGGQAQVIKPRQDFLGIGEGMERFGNAVGGAMIGAAVGSVSLSMILGLATSVTDYQFTYDSRHRSPESSKTAPLNPESQPK